MPVDIDREAIAAFCRRHHIRKLALFGSVLREDFRPGSDVDVLVDFDPEHVPGLLRLGAIEEELAPLLGGHKPDLATFRSLNRHIREPVLASAEPVYGQVERPLAKDHVVPRTAKDDALYLHHMRDNAIKARELLANRKRAAFHADETLRLALTYVVQVIGEAASRVSPRTKEQHQEIQWVRIVGMRHRLVHDYFAIDEGILWRVVTRELEPLIAQLDHLLEPSTD